MLIKGYSFYFFNALSATWLSWAGILAILCAVAAVIAFLYLKKDGAAPRVRIAGALLTIAFGLFTFGFYTAIYDVAQEGDFLLIAKEFPDDENCGSAWTQWFPAGAGLINPCKKGCYRGTTLRQQIKMVNFPPWPVTRREIQCWVRKPSVISSALTDNEAGELTP